MENAERKQIEGAIESNFEIRKLYNRHRLFERRLRKLRKQSYLTPQEREEERQIKVMKLYGVEKMLKLVANDD